MTASLGALAATFLFLLALPAAVPLAGHYVPQAGDRFDYGETIFLTDGVGNYTGYTEHSYYNGSRAVTAVAPNGTESATYNASGVYRNNQGQSQPWKENGSFTFSAVTFRYVQGTDNQTGYVNPYVWFYMDSNLTTGATFYFLNTQMTVVSTDYPFPYAASPTGFVRTIYAVGVGSYLRSDSYGTFTAEYSYKAYFDPSTGYIVGYLYEEVDRDSLGNGFTYTDTLTDTSTTFALTPAPAPAATSPQTAFPWVLVIVGLVVVALVAVVAAVLLRRRRARGGLGRAPLPRHSQATVLPTPPGFERPPPIDLTPRDQPRVQQVVLRETVKVPCRFCGTLIDSTDTACPKCGAPRT